MVLPDHGMNESRTNTGAAPAHSSAAHYLSVVVDRNRNTDGIARNWCQFMNGVSPPDHGLVVEHLWRNTIRVLSGVLRESHDQSMVVRSCGSAVIAAQRSQRFHEAIAPTESAARLIASIASASAWRTHEGAKGLS